jgi:hypothetical protein
MFVLYYIEYSNDDDGEVTLIKASDDLTKLSEIQYEMIAQSTEKANAAAARQQEIYTIYDNLRQEVKNFLARNKNAIKNGPLHISDGVWATAHDETKNHIRDQQINSNKFASYFFPGSCFKVEDLLELDKITEPIPQLGELPPKIDFPDPSYSEDNLLIGEVTVI